MQNLKELIKNWIFISLVIHHRLNVANTVLNSIPNAACDAFADKDVTPLQSPIPILPTK
jgi:hypothetical protein